MTSARQEPLNGRPAAGARDEGTETVLDWLALYMPSWGTSFVLHAAVLVLAAFVTWQTHAEAVSFDVTGQPLVPKIYDIDRRSESPQATGDGRESRGLATPGQSSLVRMMEVPVPDVASNNLDPLLVIGIKGAGSVFDGKEGFGTGSGWGFWGVGSPRDQEARKIVYVVDRSGSMTDSIDYVKFELKRSIGELGEEKEFHVVFYSSGPPVEMPTRRLVNATERNKQLAFEFIDGVIAQGETDPSKALGRAFEVRPELVYLLTDGEFDRAIVGLVRGLNAGDRVRVHTIGFLYRVGEKVLKQIAVENGGNYKFVSEGDLGR